MLRVLRERRRFIPVGQFQQQEPVIPREVLDLIVHGRVVRRRPIARHHAVPQERVVARVDRVLEVAVDAPVGHPAIDGVDRVVDIDDVDQALQLQPRAEPQGHVHDHAEETVAADDQAEQLRLFVPRALDDLAVGVDQGEALDILADWPHHQAPPVGVAGHGAAESEGVGPGLLLPDRVPLLAAREVPRRPDHIRPHRARLHGEKAALLVERDRPIHPGHVQERAVRAELLTAHRMTSTADRQPPAAWALLLHAQDRLPHIVDSGRPDDLEHARRIQPRMHVVDNLLHVKAPMRRVPRVPCRQLSK